MLPIEMFTSGYSTTLVVVMVAAMAGLQVWKSRSQQASKPMNVAVKKVGILLFAFLSLAFGVISGASAQSFAPVCTLSASSTTVTQGNSVFLTTSCTNGPITTETFTASPPGGLVVTGVGTATFTPTVSATVTYVGTNAFGSPSAPVSVFITVLPPVPACTISGAPTVPVAPGTATPLTANCTNSPTSFQWYTLGSTVPFSTSSGVTVTPAVTTTYQVIAFNAGGSSAPANVTITVLPVPVCTISGAPTGPVASGTTLTLTANCTNAPTGFQWSAVGSAAVLSTASTLTVTPAASTSYQLIATNATGASSPVTAAVTVLPPPPVCTISGAPATPVLAGTAVTLSASCSNAPTSFQWTTGGSTAPFSTGSTVTVTPLVATSYQLVAANAGGASAPVAVAIAIAPPVPVCTISGAPSGPVAAGSAVPLTAICTNAPTSYQWTIVGTGTVLSTTSTLALTPALSASYQLVASNAGGSSTPVSVAVAIAAAPSAPVCTISGAPGGAVAAGTALTLSANCSNSPTAFEWSATSSGSVLSTAATLAVAPSATTSYQLIALNAAGPSVPVSATVTVTVVVVVQPVPVCTISGAPTTPVAPGSSVTLSANCSNSPTGYQWSIIGSAGIISSAANLSVTPSLTTGYQLVAMNATGASAPVTASVQVGTQGASLVPVNPSGLVAVPGTPLQLEVLVTGTSTPALPLIGATVRWTVQSGSGDTLSSPTSVTDANGKARINLTIGAAAGNHVVRASADGAAPYDFAINNAVTAIQQPATQITQAQLQAAVIMTQAQLVNIRARLEQLRAQRGRNRSSADIKVTAQGTPIPVDQIAAAVKSKELAQGRGASADEFERWGVFVNGDVNFGKQTPDNWQGFELSTRGITAGADYRFENGLVIGAGLGVAKSSTDLLGNAGKQNSNGNSFSLYGSYTPTEKMYIDMALNLGRNNYNTDRRLLSLNGATAEIANSAASGNQSAFSVTAGGDFYKDSWRFNPYVRAEYIRATIDGFTESGSSQNLQISSHELAGTWLTVGLQTSYAISTSFGVVTPQGRLEFSRQNTNNADAGTASLVNGGSPLALARIDQSGSFGMAGLGVTVLLARGVNTFLNYEAMFNKANTTFGRWTFGVSIPF